LSKAKKYFIPPAVPLIEIVGDAVKPVVVELHDAAKGTIRFCDAIEVDDATSKYAPVVMANGYIKAMPRVARTGIQTYTGAECGRPDMPEVRVYRSEDAVFAPAAVKSLTHLPLTIEHPKRMVDASNWKEVAVGETGEDTLRDGGSIRVPMMLRDSKAIKAYTDGKSQLSVGYDCDLEWTAGTTPEGEVYDASQHNINGNHIAFTSQARGGPTLSVGDTNHISKGVTIMADLKTVVVDGITCEMSDTAAQVVNRTIAQFNAQLDAWKKKDKDDKDKDEEDCKKDAAKDAAILTKDAEIATLKAQLTDAAMTPAKLDALVKERTAVIDKASIYMNKTIKADGLSVADVRRQVVDAKLGDVAKGWNDDQVAVSFSSLTADVKAKATDGSIKDAATVFAQPHRSGFVGGDTVDAQTRKDAAYDAYDKDISQAWQRKTVTV